MFVLIDDKALSEVYQLLTLLHSDRPKLHLASVNATGLKERICCSRVGWLVVLGLTAL